MITLSIIEDIEDDGIPWRPILAEDLVPMEFNLDDTLISNTFEISIP